MFKRQFLVPKTDSNAVIGFTEHAFGRRHIVQDELASLREEATCDELNGMGLLVYRPRPCEYVRGPTKNNTGFVEGLPFD